MPPPPCLQQGDAIIISTMLTPGWERRGADGLLLRPRAQRGREGGVMVREQGGGGGRVRGEEKLRGETIDNDGERR